LEDNLDKSNVNRDNDKFGILLTHQPIGLEKLKNYPIDLEVAGHTHH
jgi:predicted MPP superfamily phosphohydrolase